jgi:glycosyltransferase involved in cell wall biosynthesis
MNMNNNLSVIMLVYNEELHIKRCLENLVGFCQYIYIVDSFSTDKTLNIAKKYTDNIFTGNFSSFSEKLNWAIENLPISTVWTMRLDADEIITDNFKKNIYAKLETAGSDVGGIYIRRQLWFMRRWMKHGDMYPAYSMRIWKTRGVTCENRLLDEHMMLKEGTSITLNLDIIDNPLISIATWVGKHNKYSDLEMISYFETKTSTMIESKFFGNQGERRRWLKNTLFYKMPLFFRPVIYFIYRYIIRFGFLDGKEGLVWHVLHGFWYRFLVDVKVYDIHKKAINDKQPIEKIIEKDYGYKI